MKKRFIILLLITVLFLAVYFVLKKISQPTFGHNNVAASNAKVSVKSTNTTSKISISTDNSYFNFSVPSGFEIQNSSTQKIGNLLFSQSYINSSNEIPLIIQIGIYQDNGDITTNSSYSLRLNNPNTYKIEVYDGSYLSYSNKYDGVVAFSQHLNELSVISVTTGLQDSGNFLNNEMTVAKALLSSWQWK